MLQNYWKFSKRNVQTYGFVYHDTNGLNHGPVWKTQSFLLILLQDCCGKGNLRKSYCSTVGKRFPIGMLIRTPLKRVILICVCGRHKTGWEETKHWPNVESTDDTSWFGWTNIISWPRLFGLHATSVWNKRRHCRQSQNYVWIQDLRRSKRKATLFRDTWCKHLYMVLRYGRSCKEMCRAILQAGWQNKSAIIQSRNSMHWRPSFQKKKNWNPWENCPKYALKLSWNVCSWHALVDQTYCGL